MGAAETAPARSPLAGIGGGDRTVYAWSMSHGTLSILLERLSKWLESTSWHDAFVDAAWFVPAVQTIHILGIAVVVTTLAMLNVRLMRGRNATPSLPELARTLLPWTWSALLILLLTGILLIITEPERELISTPFRIKMLLVLLLTGLTWAVQRTVQRDEGFWYTSPLRRTASSLIGIANILLCGSIVTAGRLIAYILHG